MSTIDVTDRLVLHQDDVFTFHDEIGFQLAGDAAPELINGGRISLTKSNADSSIALIVSSADDAMVWNKAAGNIRVRADDDGGFGLWVQGEGATLRNDGHALFEAEGAVVGALADGVGTRFINNGVWRVETGDRAGGAYLFNDAAVNTGNVSVASSNAASFGFYMPGTQFTNSGVIKVTGFDDAAGISFFDSLDAHLLNSGRIVAKSADSASIGITLPGAGYGTIENSGVIRADHAIWSPFSDELQTIVNSGKQDIADQLADAIDHVTNTGLIEGEVSLGDGYDRYDGSDGVLKGVLWGGFGYDTLIGGKGGDEIHGDEAISYGFDGADLVDGGAGNDTLFGGGGADTLRGGNGADFLHGEAGADLLDGGGGQNVYVYTALADSAPGAADTISHFSANDWIDLSPIDADPGTPGDQAFARDQVTLTLDRASGQTSIAIDADRDGTADFLLVVTAGHVGFDHLVL